MYLEHFGLREAPFSITPHTEFFFAGANRGNTLEALIYAITHDEGIVKVSGEVGSGKTMLCRMLLEKLPKHVETVYLAAPSLSREEILHAIADELKIELPVMRAHQMMRALQERLLEIYASGRLVVVMIDEAHAMPAETLEEIRLLSNLETNRHKLLHIVLFGQPELDERLSEKGLRQLKDRITHNFALEPLRHDDIGNYLMFRLRAAGYRGPDLFTASAIRMVSKASQGLTRRINILADKGLLSAFADGRHLVDSRQMRAAIRDAQLTPMQDYRKRSVLTVSAIVAVLLLAFAMWHVATPQAPIAAKESVRSDENKNAVSTAPVAPIAADNARATETTTAAPTTAGTPAATPTSSPTLAERIAATEKWLDETPDTHYFIQLLSTDGNSDADVQLFVDGLINKVDPAQIRVYRSRLSGRDRIGVIYGDYATREAANSDLARLSAINPAGNPYIRTVGKLK